jgi:hypothetical protein
MAVTFTSNIGLAKPDDTELAKNWAIATQLADDNKLIIIDQMDITLSTYTPVIAAQTTAPSLGAGTSKGEYQDIQGIIMGSFLLEFVDPGVTVGSGEYGISLPFTADNTFHNVGTAFNATPGSFSVIGDGYIYDSGGVATAFASLDVVTVGGVSYVRLLTEAHTAPAKTSRIARDSMPVALGTLDKFVGNFIYKRT